MECRAARRSALDRPQPGLAFFRRVRRRGSRIPFQSCPGGRSTTDGDRLCLPPDAAQRAGKRSDRLLRRFLVGASLWIVERAFRSLAARPDKSSRRWPDIRLGRRVDPVYAHDGFTRVVVVDRGPDLRGPRCRPHATRAGPVTAAVLSLEAAGPRDAADAACWRSRSARVRASWVLTSGGLARRPRSQRRADRPGRRRAAFWCRTRCWRSIRTRRSRSCWRTSSRIMCTAISGRGSFSSAALIVGGFYLAARVLARFAVPLGLRGSADVAGLPLLLLAAGAVSLLTVPLAHAMSRALRTQRRSVRARPDDAIRTAFISAMRRLGNQNLAEEHPSEDRAVAVLQSSAAPRAHRRSAGLHEPLNVKISSRRTIVQRRALTTSSPCIWRQPSSI